MICDPLSMLRPFGRPSKPLFYHVVVDSFYPWRIPNNSQTVPQAMNIEILANEYFDCTDSFQFMRVLLRCV